MVFYKYMIYGSMDMFFTGYLMTYLANGALQFGGAVCRELYCLLPIKDNTPRPPRPRLDSAKGKNLEDI